MAMSQNRSTVCISSCPYHSTPNTWYACMTDGLRPTMHDDVAEKRKTNNGKEEVDERAGEADRCKEDGAVMCNNNSK